MRNYPKTDIRVTVTGIATIAISNTANPRAAIPNTAPQNTVIPILSPLGFEAVDST
jgi:hypothetical protein